MSDFIPTENDLIVNPITGKMGIGKNVDSYEGISPLWAVNIFLYRVHKFTKKQILQQPK